MKTASQIKQKRSLLRLKKADHTVGKVPLIPLHLSRSHVEQKIRNNRNSDTCHADAHTCAIKMIKRSKTRSSVIKQWSRAWSFVRSVNNPWERSELDQSLS